MVERKNTDKDYRSALNAFRGLAAIFVAVYHLRYFTNFDWFGAFPVLQFGYMGVDFFFVLSGLIISHTYLAKSSISDRSFWIKFIWYRLARLFPVHLLLMLAMLIPVFINSSPLSGQQIFDWLSLTLLIRQWFMPEAYVWNVPAWSISTEFFAYVVIFPFVVWAAPFLRSKFDGMKLIGIGLMCLLALILRGGTLNDTAFDGPLLRVSGGFILGCGLFILLRYYKSNDDWDKRLLALLLCTPSVFFVAVVLRSWGYPADLLLLANFVLVISCVYLGKGRIASMLSARPLFMFGEVSFSLYLCHVPLMTLCKYTANQLGYELGFSAGVAMVGLSLCLAYLLYQFVEVPAREFMRSWYSSRDLKTTEA